jgi:hypothetical protein
MIQEIWILFAVFANQYEVVAVGIGAVFEVTGFTLTMSTFTYRFSVVAKFYHHRHTLRRTSQCRHPFDKHL